MNSSSLRRFGGYLRTRWVSPRRVRFWLLVLVLVYTLLGFFGLPWLVQHFAVNTVKEDFGRELRIGAVHFNPFTLALQIDDLALDDTDSERLLGWQQLFVDLQWSGLIDKDLVFQTIRLHKPVIHEERFASGTTRLARLAPEPTEEAPAEEESGPLPALQINDLSVTGATVSFTDNLQNANAGTSDTPERVTLALQDTGLSIRDFSLQEGSGFPVRLEGQLAGGGGLAFDGTLQLLPALSLEGNARIDALALGQAQPYLKQFANVQLTSGTLNLNGQVQTDTQQPFSFRGSAGIESLMIREGGNDEPLIGWQSLKTEQLDLSLAEKQLETDPILIDGLSGRFIIHEDQTTNFGQLMAGAPADSGKAESEKADSGKADAGEHDKTAGTDEEAAPFGIIIEGIELTDGALRFADHSLPLPFSTSIHTLNGQISTLNSTSAQPAEVALEGEVAEYGLVTVEGAVHPWHPMRGTSVQLRFRNLLIPEYSPYTVRFAGRKIAKGTMDLDLDYSIKDEQLEGRNKLVLRDLKLGEKMDSGDAMDLPLDLAIALLKNSDGVIDLALPVTGNVGSPEFDIGKVIRQAVRKAITSVVQSPFRFLANLVGAESEDLNRVEFPKGRSDLLPPQRERIAKLREALNQRPALGLKIAGPFSRTFDGPVLKRKKAIAALQQRLAEAGREIADPSLTAESSQGVVEAMFTSYYPDTNLATVKARFTEKQNGSSGENAFDALAYRSHLAERVIAAQPVSEADLKAIASARADAVRDALADPDAENSIDAGRIRFKDPEEIDSVDGERIAMKVAITAD